MPKTSNQNTKETFDQKIDTKEINESEKTTRSEDNLNTSSIELSKLGTETTNTSFNLSETDKLKQTENAKKTELKKAKNKVLKSIECTIWFFLIENTVLVACSILIKICLFNKQDGLPIANIIISSTSLAFNLMLMVSVKCGLSNDSNAKKLFRVLVIIIFLMLLVNFSFQILISYYDYKYNINEITLERQIIYSLSVFSIILFLPTSFKGFLLCFESCLILTNLKKEYKQLFIDEKDRFFSYNKFYRQNYGENRVDLLNNVARFMPEKIYLENINPVFYKFHNSVNINRQDDLYYHKAN